MKSCGQKGFTLTEILAVIVVLGILAVIIIPIVNNLLGDSEDSLYNEQIGMIINATKKYMVEHSELLPEEKGKNSISLDDLVVNGVIDNDEILDPKTKEQMSGCVVVNYNKDFNQYEYSFVDDSNSLCQLKISKVVDNVKYYDTEWIKNTPIYFDPTSGKCDVAEYSSNSEKLGKTGCMRWYAYSENSDGTVNMILDHNTTGTSKVAWTSVANYFDEFVPATVGVTYPDSNIVFTDGEYGDNAKGPLTVLARLKTHTADWNEYLNRSDIYSLSAVYDSIIRNFQINYNGYKARLISLDEIYNIIGLEEYKGKYPIENYSGSNIYLDGLYGDDINWKTQVSDSNSKSVFSWLYTNLNDCENYGCDSSFSGPKGYWTSSSRSSDRDVWCITSDGKLSFNYSSDTSKNGVRPVITVNKNDIL